MNASIISAVSALLGAAIGGLASFLASWMTQRTQVRAQWLMHDKLRRHDLYREFMEEASKCYMDALQHAEGDIPSLVTLYTKINRIRILSPPNVVDSAEQIGRKILDTYLEPERSFLELREMTKNNSIDILHDFTKACRDEFESLRTQQL
jgi:hypothetical protein